MNKALLGRSMSPNLMRKMGTEMIMNALIACRSVHHALWRDQTRSSIENVQLKLRSLNQSRRQH